MSISTYSFSFPSYELVQFIPVGRKYPTIRSIGHKKQRAALTRIHNALENKLMAFTSDEKVLLASFLGSDSFFLPIPIYKEEELYPTLLRPETFLWQTHSVQRGIPIQPDYFYDIPFADLPTQEFDAHIDQVLADYLFCAVLYQQPRHKWLEEIATSYSLHPFIQLAKKKQAIVHAVEAMNKSSLLSVLNYPEDVAYWRHRVEIVLRPYRDIPTDMQWEFCQHEKTITINAKKEQLTCYCANCDYDVAFSVPSKTVTLRTEVDLPQATKRIATIQRQVEDIATNSPKVIHSLTVLQKIKQTMLPYQETFERLEKMQTQVDGLHHPLVTCYEALQKIHFPEDVISTDLLTLSVVHLRDVALLKQADNWANLLTDDWSTQLHSLTEAWEEAVANASPKPEDVVFQWKEYSLTRKEVEVIADYLQTSEEEIPTQMLIKVLNGEATSKIRRIGLHESPIFGLLTNWQQKHIIKALQATNLT